MTTLDDAAARAQAAIGALEAASAHLTRCGDDLDSIVAQFETVGVYAMAQSAAIARARVDEVLTQIAALRDGIERLVASIVNISGGTAATTAGTRDTSGSIPSLLFDASAALGPLGKLFRPGVYEVGDTFSDKERAIAQHLADVDGACVHRRVEDHTMYGLSNPDAIVRNNPDDRGRLTEFKTLERGTTSAVKGDIIKAGKQLAQHGGGDAVLDGRDVNLDEATARIGHARAVGQARAHRQALPRRTRVILADGRYIDLGAEA